MSKTTVKHAQLPIAFVDWVNTLVHEPKKAYAYSYAQARILGNAAPEPPKADWVAKTQRKVDALVPVKFSVPVAKVAEAPEPKRLPKLDQALLDVDPIDGPETLKAIKAQATAAATAKQAKGSAAWWDVYRSTKHELLTKAIAANTAKPGKRVRSRKAKAA